MLLVYLRAAEAGSLTDAREYWPPRSLSAMGSDIGGLVLGKALFKDRDPADEDY
jgi:hypothetical protein